MKIEEFIELLDKKVPFHVDVEHTQDRLYSSNGVVHTDFSKAQGLEVVGFSFEDDCNDLVIFVKKECLHG